MLPVGHTFNRISTMNETAFKTATYATHSTEDFNRYLSVFTHELGSKTLHHVSFKAVEEIKVPSLAKRLEVFGQVLNSNANGKTFTSKEILKQYEHHCGGSWKSDIARSFFDALKSEGYSAIIDDMDAGVIGNSPLVIFNKLALGSMTSEIITPERIALAENSLIELAHRK